MEINEKKPIPIEFVMLLESPYSSQKAHTFPINSRHQTDILHKSLDFRNGEYK
jgi:hypothetical protein